MKITNPYGPNTTLLLPGSCNASCSFCFWNQSEAKIRQPDNYTEKVFSTIENLPEEFRTLSLSGGEPTLSPYFGRVLAALGKFRRGNHLDRVVLTTQGGNLAPFITAVGCVVDHINISRHEIGYHANVSVFKTTNIPTDEELTGMIKKIHTETSCDVTLNCVIPADVTVHFCHQFIKYARSLGADAVSFRKVASNASPTGAEIVFAGMYGISSKTKCPVCRGMEQKVDGFTVRWKGSVTEPSQQTNGVYELVIHPDGNLYSDWSMSSPVLIYSIQEQVKKRMPITITPSFSGCGSGSSSRSGC